MLLTKSGRRLSKDGKNDHSLSLQDQVTLDWTKSLSYEACEKETKLSLHQEVGNSSDGSLQELKRNWGTPTTRDWKDAGLKKQLKPMKNGSLRLNLIPQQILDVENYRGYVNPRWVEAIMGLPIGWVRPSSTQVVIIEQTSLDSLGME
jgi:hypothetical protein